MSKLPFMPLYVADYLRDTRCLSLATQGAWMNILCTLWNSPTRGKRTLSIDGWAGEIGKPISQVDLAFEELKLCGVGKISSKISAKNIALITIQSGRMVRDEAQRKRKAKNKKDQRVRELSPGMSPPASPACPVPVTGLSPGDDIFQKSDVILHTKKEGEDRKKEKSVGEGTALARPAKSDACWQAYRTAYEAVWKVPPVRNSRVNADLCQLVDRLGAELAPRVAGFYPTHRRELYLTARHPTNLLVRDAEALRTDFLTGQTTSETPRVRSVVELIG